MEQQEYFMRMQMLGQEAEKIEQQIQSIDQQMSEMNAVKESIQAINDGKQKEILANLGKGIFISAEIKSKELLVNIGKEIILKKTPEETVRIIDDQNKKLMAGKEQFIERIQELQVNMQELLMQAQNQAGEHSHEHAHAGCGDEDCKCEEPCEDCECEKKGKKKR
jgi:prefoldin alpha subunit